MKIERVAIVTHEQKSRALELEKDVTRAFDERGIEVTDQHPDLVMSLGGDGTTLRAAQRAHDSDAPLLSVNVGMLGYLTEVDADEAMGALERILAGDYRIEDRMMVACEIGAGPEAARFVGLNEVLVERTSPHLVRLRVEIGGESLAAFNADGIIVATPTGSTAYSLSAGGPIVSPRAQCLIVVPVSAHMIFSRPFVLAPDETVEITFEGRDEKASVTLDGGPGCEIPSGTEVRVGRHERPLRLVRLSGPGFLERLRIKLDLPG